MKVKLICQNQITNLVLPKNVMGNYWLSNNKNENLINIEAVNGTWILKSNLDYKVVENNTFIDYIKLEKNRFYLFCDTSTNEYYRIYTCDSYYRNMATLEIATTSSLNFFIGNSNKKGSGSPNYISYENPYFNFNQLQILPGKGGIYYIKNLDSKIPMFVNDFLVNEAYLKFGDIVFIEGLVFTFIGKKLMINGEGSKLQVDTSKFTVSPKGRIDYSLVNNLPDSNIELYEKKDYFIRPPRFNEVIGEKDISIASPPQKQEAQQIPLIITMGSMIVMGMGSSITGVMALIKVMRGEATFQSQLTSIITAFSMLVSMLLFPTISRLYQKHNMKKREKQRLEKYRKYLSTVNDEIKEEAARQKRILEDNNVDLKNVGSIILYKKRNLWERKEEHSDFLELRLGVGNVPVKINFKYQNEAFSMDDDELKKELKNVVEQNNILENVPVTFSFREKYVSALIGKYDLLRKFIDGLILQMITFHSYDELKIVIITNKLNSNYWDKFKDLPYLWNNEKSFRYYGTTPDDISKISNELENEFQTRSENDKEGIIHKPYYMIITDEVLFSSKIGIINQILKNNHNLGFSILYLTDRLNTLPSECTSFINVDTNLGGIFENELANQKQEFVPDFMTENIQNYIYATSNIPVEINNGSFVLPEIYTFNEMYDIGNVYQLNSINRWRENNPSVSLSCPVGINESGELFKLDLHEKMYGPHGLIAGMTGSGKSEFIITYILSMCVNYDPREVQFVLIDYKGGGLAGAFENKELGIKLPHLAGTITNLDKNNITRSLSSLQSELKRRQRVFNEARDKCNESTMDIYKYQKLYRDGKVDEPISHLFIISDEFAELKAQQPDFMDELISTARIGRSLGVHLILATQKPSGVVNDQIWSNSKFKICLKVQDKSDSNDMIKSPDAAYIKETGRFILQVGFNEYYALGQSAWSGAPYYESDKRVKNVDTSINFVDNTGGVFKSIDIEKQNVRGIHKGEQLSNILKYLIDVQKHENISVKQLWLDIIPAFITINNLVKKYSFKKENFVLNPVIGELDAPKEQRQALLTLPISNVGNTLIYGITGSGKEKLLSAVLYSLITMYTPNEVNAYILDFGTEMLKSFSKAPHIGGIVGSADSDKINILFQMIENEISYRKKLFSDYNGSYQYYIRKSPKKIPNMLVIINGFESFSELYDEYTDRLVVLTREASRYGIYFIITANSLNGVRMKLSQNFNEKILLQLNDDYDYRQVFGRTEVVPSRVYGRGLIKREDVYEFQTASIIDDDRLNDFVINVCEKLNAAYNVKAKPIPVLPEIVTTNEFDLANIKFDKVPLGLNKDTLETVSVNLKRDLSLLVSSNDIKNKDKFVSSLVYLLSLIPKSQTFVLDNEKNLKNHYEGVKYYSEGFKDKLSAIDEAISSLNDIYVKADYDIDSLKEYKDIIIVINGLKKLQNIVGEDFERIITNLANNAKSLSKVHFVIIDDADNLKENEYQSWYKLLINNSKGIWIGSGILSQNTIKTYSTRGVSDNITDSFAYKVDSNSLTLFKIVEEVAEDNE